MGARFRSWWQQIKKHRVAIGVVAIVLVVAIALIIIGYWFDWTGFNVYSIKWTAKTPSGTTLITVDEQQPAKTLYDWLQLLGILAIPVVVGFGAAWFTIQQSQAEADRAAQQVIESEANRKKRHETDIEIAEKNRELQRETDLQIAADNRQEAALQGYIDKITELIQRNVIYGNEGRKIARAQTLTVLPRLDGDRKRSVLQFLQAAHLIDSQETIIDLRSADLIRANLTRTNLAGTNLREVDLENADLSGADLSGADLSGAVLARAKLRLAALSRANLSGVLGTTTEQLDEALLGGATMPDGSIHP